MRATSRKNLCCFTVVLGFCLLLLPDALATDKIPTQSVKQFKPKKGKSSSRSLNQLRTKIKELSPTQRELKTTSAERDKLLKMTLNTLGNKAITKLIPADGAIEIFNHETQSVHYDNVLEIKSARVVHTTQGLGILLKSVEKSPTVPSLTLQKNGKPKGDIVMKTSTESRFFYPIATLKGQKTPDYGEKVTVGGTKYEIMDLKLSTRTTAEIQKLVKVIADHTSSGRKSTQILSGKNRMQSLTGINKALRAAGRQIDALHAESAEKIKATK